MILPYKNSFHIPLGSISLEGELSIPKAPGALVVFALGSGSSRFSPSNNFLARQLQKKHIATFLLDELTREEQASYRNRFDVNKLTDRLVHTVKWLKKISHLAELPWGFLASDTGAASSILAANELNDQIRAIVLRGGRSDLAGKDLSKLHTPTLFILPETDLSIRRLNEVAFESVNCVKGYEVVKGAHLFDEAGAMEKVSDLAGNWFLKYLIGKNSGKYQFAFNDLTH